jgi:hypothetical protein
MSVFEKLLRSTVSTSRRIVGLPLVLDRLAQMDDRLERVSAALTKETAVGVPWHTCSYDAVMGQPQVALAAPARLPLSSGLCRQGDFALDAYRYWMGALRETPRFHRKQWEYFFIAQALHERGMLTAGRRALGFGVGQERLPALFASMGCDVVATDQVLEGAVRGGWAETGQHATDIQALNKLEICDQAAFRERVAFRSVDMNSIPADLSGQFDFCWSTCSFEHLGSLEHGKRFVEASVATLRPGGVAVHTTEFNLSSNADTFESRDLSIYRRCDIEDLVHRLHRAGCRVEPIEWNPKTGFVDDYVDLPPYRQSPHLRLRIGEFDCTSIGLIIVKGQPGSDQA